MRYLTPLLATLCLVSLLAQEAPARSAPPNRSRRHPAQAPKSCSPAEVDEAAMGPYVNQGTTALCYAFATAALLSFDSGKQVSALAIAIHHNLYRAQYDPTRSASEENKERAQLTQPDRVPFFGWPHSAILASDYYGLCSEDSIRSYLPQVDLQNPKSRQNKLYELLNNIHAEDHYDQIEASQIDDWQLQFIFRKLKIDEIKDILLKAGKENRWKQIIRASCERVPQRKLGQRLKRAFAAQIAPTMIEALDAQIGESRPVIVNLNRGDLDTLAKGEKLSPFQTKPSVSDHAVIALARRWNGEQCEYKIRDTLGCGEHWQPRADCPSGYYWLSRKELLALTDEVVYLEP